MPGSNYLLFSLNPLGVIYSRMSEYSIKSSPQGTVWASSRIAGEGDLLPGTRGLWSNLLLPSCSGTG